MYKISSTPSNNTTLWHYLGIKHLDFRHENNSASEVLIKEKQYILCVCACMRACMCVYNTYICMCIMIWEFISGCRLFHGFWLDNCLNTPIHVYKVH